MDDRNVLQHLLKVEAEAAALVHDAQAEADRRLAHGEQESRLRYDEGFGREAAALEAGYEQAIAAVRADYQKQLDAYQVCLDTMTVRQDRFAALVESLLSLHGEP
ncbi:MAG: hypothetical protein LBT13_09510 [Treponema sp.]|jgi:hypothetical protein|nr:hypothetical protein [Treponema sp.]